MIKEEEEEKTVENYDIFLSQWFCYWERTRKHACVLARKRSYSQLEIEWKLWRGERQYMPKKHIRGWVIHYGETAIDIHQRHEKVFMCKAACFLSLEAVKQFHVFLSIVSNPTCRWFLNAVFPLSLSLSGGCRVDSEGKWDLPRLNPIDLYFDDVIVYLKKLRAHAFSSLLSLSLSLSPSFNYYSIFLAMRQICVLLSFSISTRSTFNGLSQAKKDTNLPSIYRLLMSDGKESEQSDLHSQTEKSYSHQNKSNNLPCRH